MSEQNQLTKELETGAVESVVLALHKVINLLDRIKTAIEESSNKIPRASVQLDTVTQATEMATVEILNVLDTMTLKVGNVEEELASLKPHVGTGAGETVLEGIGQHLEDIKQDTINITMALQVQDITAQRIAAANHLIECVRMELMHELSYFENSGQPPAKEGGSKNNGEGERKEGATFDRDALYRKSSDHQERIDRVVQEWKEKQGQ